MMARQVSLDKLKAAEASARQALASAHAKAEKLRRQVEAAEKAEQRAWEKTVGHLAWVAGLRQWDIESLREAFTMLASARQHIGTPSDGDGSDVPTG
jgi:septal ring factor EnvC (AmiA/AmiB activator)